MFGRLHGLWLDEEISFETNFPAVISGGSQEYSHMIQLPFHHGIKKVHIPFAAAPEHIVFSSQFHRSIQCRDRKSTRLNSSHVAISYAVFCLKKKHNRPH